jgi:hypothetical protein
VQISTDHLENERENVRGLLVLLYAFGLDTVHDLFVHILPPPMSLPSANGKEGTHLVPPDQLGVLQDLVLAFRPCLRIAVQEGLGNRSAGKDGRRGGPYGEQGRAFGGCGRVQTRQRRREGPKLRRTERTGDARGEGCSEGSHG